MNKIKFNLLLADDDEDDCAFFQDALDDLDFTVTLKTLNDGVQLMDYLSESNYDNLPDVLFLDLNMPRKSGFECLSEIKSIHKLKALPIIIFSTSFDMNIVDLVYDKGATFYIRKPGEFSKLKKVIEGALTTVSGEKIQRPTREHFVIQA